MCTISLCFQLSGVSTFAEHIRGRNVVVWSDNKGAEAAARKGRLDNGLLVRFMHQSVSSCFVGSAKQFDHGSLIHALWKRFVELNVGAWIERVPTKVCNIMSVVSCAPVLLLMGVTGKYC